MVCVWSGVIFISYTLKACIYKNKIKTTRFVCAQNNLTILSSLVNIIGEIYMIT